MKLGVFTTLLSNLSLEEALKYFTSLGIEMVEIGVGGYPGNAHADPEVLLNDEKAFEEIKDSFKQKNVTLLHGVTSAGKTEIYIHLITEALERGEQVLFMLPEIALTKQITERLRRVFGNKIGVYHSKFSDAERVELHQAMNMSIETEQEKHFLWMK